MAGIYAQKSGPYVVRDSLFEAFGRDPGWWLTLVGVLVLLFVLEMAFKMTKRTMVILGLWRWLGRGWWKRVRRWRRKKQVPDWMDGNLEDWDLGMWQEMEQDGRVRDRLRGILEAEEGDELAAALMDVEEEVGEVLVER